MSARLADLLMYALLAGIGGIVLWQTYDLPNPFGGSVGSGGFPGTMAVIMIIFCGIGAVRTLIGPTLPRLDFPGMGKMAITLAAMITFFAIWQVFGYFFPLAFVFLSGLLCLYAADETLTPRIAIINLIASAISLTLIYMFFTYVLFVRF